MIDSDDLRPLPRHLTFIKRHLSRPSMAVAFDPRVEEEGSHTSSPFRPSCITFEENHRRCRRHRRTVYHSRPHRQLSS